MATPESPPAVSLDVAELGATSPDIPAGPEEVAGYIGTMESAIEDHGLLERPVALTWQRWQIYRTATATRPSTMRVGGRGSQAEAMLWRRIMLHYHGKSWRAASKALKETD